MSLALAGIANAGVNYIVIFVLIFVMTLVAGTCWYRWGTLAYLTHLDG